MDHGCHAQRCRNRLERTNLRYNYGFYQSVLVACTKCPSAVSDNCILPLICTDIVLGKEIVSLQKQPVNNIYTKNYIVLTSTLFLFPLLESPFSTCCKGVGLQNKTIATVIKTICFQTSLWRIYDYSVSKKTHISYLKCNKIAEKRYAITGYYVQTNAPNFGPRTQHTVRQRTLNWQSCLNIQAQY